MLVCTNIFFHLFPKKKQFSDNVKKKTDNEVLADACWAISYLSDGPNDRIDYVVQQKITKRLVELLKHPYPQVQTPSLRFEFLYKKNLCFFTLPHITFLNNRTIGNIVTGNDEQTQEVVNAGALPALRELLTHAKKAIRKEACWTVSNITAGNEKQIQSIKDESIIQLLIKIMTDDDFDVKKEAAWAISNATSGGSKEQIEYLVNQNCIPPLCDLLKAKDARVISVALDGLQNILEKGKPTQAGEQNMFAQFVDEAGGADKIEELQYHKEEEIYEKV